MPITALILTMAGFGLWLNAYLNGELLIKSNQPSLVAMWFGGRERTITVYGLVGGTLFVLGTLGLFGLVTLP